MCPFSRTNTIVIHQEPPGGWGLIFSSPPGGGARMQNGLKNFLPQKREGVIRESAYAFPILFESENKQTFDLCHAGSHFVAGDLKCFVYALVVHKKKHLLRQNGRRVSIELFSLYVLFSQYRSCVNTLEN